MSESDLDTPMAGMAVHCGAIWRTACEFRDRAVAAVRDDPKAWPPHTIVALLFSAIAAEAFINELPEVVALSAEAGLPMSDSLRTFVDELKQIEQSRGSTRLKYLKAAETLSGSSFEKGKNPYRDFDVLVSIRNDLVHLKPRDAFKDPGSADPIGVPKYVQALQQRGLARTPEAGVDMSWLNRLETAEMTVWACETARAMIMAVLDLIPDRRANSMFIFRKSFRATE